MVFDNVLSKVFNNKFSFDEIIIDEDVINSIIYYSKEAYPNEFLAFFDGKLKGNKLLISSLLFLPNDSSSTGASFNGTLFPPNQKIWGTVHSHPGPSAMPSDADLMTFRKHGIFHMILCLPYSVPTMRGYNAYGESTTFKIGKVSDNNHDVMLDDLEEIRNQIEDEENR